MEKLTTIMAKGNYYFRFFYQRFIASTMGWSEEQQGAYLRLLIYQYNNGSIPSDLKEISKISKKAAKNWKFFEQKFIKNSEGNYINSAMEIERDSSMKRSVINSSNGKRGAEVRYGKGSKRHSETHSEPDSKGYSIPLTINQYKERERKKESFAGSEEVLYPIEHCLTVALNDERWVRANSAVAAQLEAFNKSLEEIGVYSKNPADYKSHFARWKKKQPDLQTQTVIPKKLQVQI